MPRVRRVVRAVPEEQRRERAEGDELAVRRREAARPLGVEDRGRDERALRVADGVPEEERDVAQEADGERARRRALEADVRRVQAEDGRRLPRAERVDGRPDLREDALRDAVREPPAVLREQRRKRQRRRRRRDDDRRAPRLRAGGQRLPLDAVRQDKRARQRREVLPDVLEDLRRRVPRDLYA